MIQSFRCAETERIFGRQNSRKFGNIARVALRKLVMLDAAEDLSDLALPGNRLEQLEDDRKGQHSIRINDQYRVCFEWKDGHPCNVENVDYH